MLGMADRSSLYMDPTTAPTSILEAGFSKISNGNNQTVNNIG